MPQARDIHGTVFVGGSATLLARVVGVDDAPITAVDIAAIHYTIFQLDERDDQAADPINGHEDIALAPGDVLLSPLQTGPPWTADDEGYNFRHELDISSDAAFPTAGRRYRVTFTLTPNTGQPILVRYDLRAI